MVMPINNQAQLVYTTDPKMAHNNIECFDESFAKDVQSNMLETIKEINRSRRKICMSNKNFGTTRRNINTDLNIAKIINALSQKPTCYADLYKLLYPVNQKNDADIKRLNNLLQNMRYASEHIIFTDKGLWQINKSYISGADALIKKVTNNLNVRNALIKQKCKTFDPPPLKNVQNTASPITIQVNNGQKEISIPLKITLTVQVKFEVIQ